MNHTIIAFIATSAAMFVGSPAFAESVNSAAPVASILPASWCDFAPGFGGSLAWAGENETFVGFSELKVDSDDDMSTDIDLVTGIAAPEPPALVLAGMAIGGVFCGRSMLRKRQSTAATTENRS
ncbi:MAG: hypothetical protein WCO90_05015 [Planctomycetota bacterium]